MVNVKGIPMNDMANKQIAVINYLDIHAVVNDGQIEEYSSKDLCNAFPDIDEFTLTSWKKDWKKARQAMLDLKL